MPRTTQRKPMNKPDEPKRIGHRRSRAVSAIANPRVIDRAFPPQSRQLKRNPLELSLILSRLRLRTSIVDFDKSSAGVLFSPPGSQCKTGGRGRRCRS